MTDLGVVRRNAKRTERAAIEAPGQYGVATVHEAMGPVALMKPCMRPGTTVTVLLPPGDNWMMHVAAEQIEPGEVLCYVLKSAGESPLA